MPEFKVKIVEYASRIIDVTASDEEMAMQIVKDQYFDEEIVLDYTDFDEVEFEMYND